MNVSPKLMLGLAAAAIAAVVAWSSIYVHDTTESVVVTRFGDPVRVELEPGLRLKIPLGIERLERISNQTHLLLPDKAEYLTRDKRNLEVSSFLLWRVADPLLFVRSVGDRAGAEARLAMVLGSEIGNALGDIEFSDVLTESQESRVLDDLAGDLRQRCAAIASSQYGIEVVDVRIRRLAFPDLNRIAVFERMRAERQRIAVKYRSEGEEQATKIRSEADLKRAQILADAEQQAALTRGEGEAEAARIYAEAVRRDPEFFEFLRTLEAYEEFIGEDTTLVLPADADLLDLLLDGPEGYR